MARKCELTGKRVRVGNKVSHSNIKTKTRNFPNLQTVRAVVDGQVKKIRVSTRAIKSGLVQKAPRKLKSKAAATSAKV